MYLYVGFGLGADCVEFKHLGTLYRYIVLLPTQRFEAALPQPADTNAYTVKMYNEIGIVCSVYYEFAPYTRFVCLYA